VQSEQQSTAPLPMASARFMPLMSQPSNTRSLGSTMGSSALKGVYTSCQGLTLVHFSAQLQYFAWVRGCM